MPIDMQMYWTEVDGGDWDTPPVPAPVWNFCDEEDIYDL